MNQNVIENLKIQLNRRAQKVCEAHYSTMVIHLNTFCKFIQNNPILYNIINQIQILHPISDEQATDIYNQIQDINNKNNLHLNFGEESTPPITDTGGFVFIPPQTYTNITQSVLDDTSIIASTYAYLLQYIKRLENTGDNERERLYLALCSFHHSFDKSELVKRFFEIYVEPIVRYLEESLDNIQLNLHLLARYKKRSEWFYQEELRKLANAKDNPSNEDLLNLPENKSKPKYDQKEIRLAENLYAFLFDEGLDFHVEEKSPHGRIDLIIDIAGGIGVEVKVFSGKADNIKKGINQLRQYMDEYQMPVGYLAIFNISPKRLDFPGTQSENKIHYFTHNCKTIYLIDIHIPPAPSNTEGRSGKPAKKTNASSGDFGTTPIDIFALL
jgi:hypothetical protein